jgi:hypothetical protein
MLAEWWKGFSQSRDLRLVQRCTIRNSVSRFKRGSERLNISTMC